MQGEQEIRSLKEELEKLTGFISDNGSAEQFAGKEFVFACNVCDSLAWVLEETLVEHFRSDSYINLELLKQIARAIEMKTGKKLDEYE